MGWKNPPERFRRGTRSTRSSRARRSSFRESPRRAETANMGLCSRNVPRTACRTSSWASSRKSGSTRSALVSTTTPSCTWRRERMSRCSRVWGMTPSSAATTKRTASMPEAPATICRIKRSCPGTSTRLTTRPLGSTRGAKPKSMVIPRRFSSLRRSQSTPVRAFTKVVLPWSICPAVPRTKGISAADVMGLPLPSTFRGRRDGPCPGSERPPPGGPHPRGEGPAGGS